MKHLFAFFSSLHCKTVSLVVVNALFKYSVVSGLRKQTTVFEIYITITLFCNVQWKHKDLNFG